MRISRVMSVVLLAVILAAGCKSGMAQNRTATQVFEFCEGGPSYGQACGTWTINGREGQVVWGDGSSAKLAVDRFDDWVDITRINPTGGVTARYTGRRFENGVYGGQVIAQGYGRQAMGTWKAIVRKNPKPAQELRTKEDSSGTIATIIGLAVIGAVIWELSRPGSGLGSEDSDARKDREQFEENQYYLQRREREEQRRQEDRER